jgi:hypothetical protein
VNKEDQTKNGVILRKLQALDQSLAELRSLGAAEYPVGSLTGD